MVVSGRRKNETSYVGLNSLELSNDCLWKSSEKGVAIRSMREKTNEQTTILVASSDRLSTFLKSKSLKKWPTIVASLMLIACLVVEI